MSSNFNENRYSFLSFLKLSVDDLFISVLESKVKSVIGSTATLSANTNIDSFSPRTPTNNVTTPKTGLFNAYASPANLQNCFTENEFDLNLSNVSPQNRNHQLCQDYKNVSLTEFIKNLTSKSKVRPATLIGTLVYLDRLKHSLPKTAFGLEECSYHRIFLAALTLSGKYLNDSSPKNKHWTLYAKIYTIEQVNKMEFEFLKLINYDLIINMNDIMQEFMKFMNAYNSIMRTPPSTHLNILEHANSMPQTPLSGMFTNNTSNFNTTPLHQGIGSSLNNYISVPRLQAPQSFLSNSTILLNRIKSGNQQDYCSSSTPLYKRRILNKMGLKLENKAITYYKNHVLPQNTNDQNTTAMERLSAPLNSAPICYGNRSYWKTPASRRERRNVTGFKRVSHELLEAADNDNSADPTTTHYQKDSFYKNSTSSSKLAPILTENIYRNNIIYNATLNFEK